MFFKRDREGRHWKYRVLFFAKEELTPLAKISRGSGKNLTNRPKLYFLQAVSGRILFERVIFLTFSL
jgi:hypothetical protein